MFIVFQILTGKDLVIYLNISEHRMDEMREVA